jgi:hypothetical protein
MVSRLENGEITIINHNSIRLVSLLGIGKGDFLGCQTVFLAN